VGVAAARTAEDIYTQCLAIRCVSCYQTKD
jgi:hypothetical protein